MADAMAALEWLRPVLEPMPRRKQLLLACAYARRFSGYWPDETCLQLVETAERFADGKAGSRDVRAVWKRCTAAWEGRDYHIRLAMYIPCELGFFAVTHQRGTPWRVFAEILLWVNCLSYEQPGLDPTFWFEREMQAILNLARELGSDLEGPFDPAWRTDVAVNLAQQVYDAQTYELMPLLADALQDAGCEDAAVLGHGRGPGPHARGCWVVDLVVGKE
jgi:hypothetical protein